LIIYGIKIARLRLLNLHGEQLQMKKNAGFTLVEIAIVLVVIGLLLGAILAGQEIVTNAQVRSSINEYNSVASAMFVYQDRYRRRPGDDNAASTRWQDTIPGVPAINGDGDGLIAGSWETGTNAEETGVFWHHLRNDGLVPGSRDGTAGSASFALPQNAFNGEIGVQENAFAGNIADTVICQSNIPKQAAAMIDTRIDDGDGAGSGSDSGGIQGTGGIDADAGAIPSAGGGYLAPATPARVVMCRQLG
jgi:prepilin-type N-terminal cleavage/methylation domain-containing protein